MATLRSQNICNDCQYTWYPRGKDLSLECPGCGGPNVAVRTISAAALLICLALIGGAFLVARCAERSGSSSEIYLPATPAREAVTDHREKDRKIAQPIIPLTYVTVEDAKRAAVKKYPDLEKSGSSFNAEFINRYRRYQIEHPDFLRDTSWPARLAEEVAESLSVERYKR